MAAAGNRHAGPRSLEKPLLPAAWEQLPAPSYTHCQELIGEKPPGHTRLSKTSYKPLVYAVGGVGQDGRILSNARPNATPRLVAFGDHAHPLSHERRQSPLPHALAKTQLATIAAPELADPLVTLTGTSVSTLVVAAAAVVLWNDSPELSPFDIMDRLWRAGPAVDPSVDFCLDPQQNCP